MSNARKGMLKGSKFNGRHSTYIDAAKPIINAARDLDCITRITLGPIENSGSGGSHLRIRPAPPAALKVIVSGGGAVQTLFIFTDDVAQAEAALTHAWKK